MMKVQFINRGMACGLLLSLSREGSASTSMEKTRKEVQEKLAAVLQDQKQGMLVATPQQTVGQFLTDWLEQTHKHSVRPRT
jgi:hypothetical protein